MGGQDDLTVLVTDRFSVEEVQLDTVLVSTLTVQEADAEDSGSYRWISTYLQIHLHTIGWLKSKKLLF